MRIWGFSEKQEIYGENMKVLLINFSNRDFGNCGTIANFVKDNLNDKVIIKSFSNMKVSSCGSCKCECFEENLKCPFVEDDVYELYKHICDSGLVYFIVPNYCDYPCSNFFKFNERSLCFFSGKKEMLDKYESISKRFIVISNGEKENFKFY